VPDLNFRIEGVQALQFAAVPTLLFKLHVENTGGEPVHAVTLNTQIRIATRHRHYSAPEQERLMDVFGEPRRWGETLNSLLWTHTVVLVPPFTGDTVVDMPVTCTYDFEVVSGKYFHGLEDGAVSLEFLFRGTIFYAGDSGLQVAQISWEKEARYQLPVSVWKELMQHYFPNSAWVRLRSDLFDRLYDYKSRNGLPTWEAALERLLPASGEGEG
jgi:hypothetical protein